MITAKNYAAQAINGFRNGQVHKNPTDWKELSLALNEIEKSIHFAIEDDGLIFNDGLKGLKNTDINLPFDSITVEFFYKGDDKGSNPRKELIFAKNKDDEIEIFFFFCKLPSNNWIAHPKKLTAKKRFENGLIAKDDIFLPMLYFNISNSDNFSELDAMIEWSLWCFLELLEALSCTNVEISTHQPASPKNAQRIKSHKLPIYETKVLTIKTGKESSSVGASIKGSHSSPRQHLRRGHIRRLETGNIWVNSCVVGSKENGVIDKQYRVQS